MIMMAEVDYLKAGKRTTDKFGIVAHYITRCIDMNWDPFLTINAGIYLLSLNTVDEFHAEMASASPKTHALYDIFIILCEHIPGMDESTDWDSLDYGKRGAKTEDNRAFKILIGKWDNWNPPIDPDSKHRQGYAHPQCAQGLAPVTVKWNDVGQRHCFLKEYNPPMTTKELFPAFLYVGYVADLDNLSKGLFGSKIMVWAIRTVIFPASKANMENNPDYQLSQKSKADTYGLEKVTPGLLAYTAVGVRYALLGETSFRSSGGTFDYEVFHNDLVAYLNKPACAKDTAELLDWWNTYVNMILFTRLG
ncbi:hypothetical protein FRC07_014896 [Ceratobasidium sp. 392]|nr:hypothetical protein FRC07_014896 [Ceratobasidium sp. 392]